MAEILVLFNMGNSNEQIDLVKKGMEVAQEGYEILDHVDNFNNYEALILTSGEVNINLQAPVNEHVKEIDEDFELEDNSTVLDYLKFLIYINEENIYIDGCEIELTQDTF